MIGPNCTFASRMQHAEDREHLGNGSLDTSLIPLHSDIEVSELVRHLGVTVRMPSPSPTLPIGERSRRDCSGLLPDELVVVPSQVEDYGRTVPPLS